MDLSEIRLGPLASDRDLTIAAQELADKENEIVRYLVQLAATPISYNDLADLPEVLTVEQIEDIVNGRISSVGTIGPAGPVGPQGPAGATSYNAGLLNGQPGSYYTGYALNAAANAILAHLAEIDPHPQYLDALVAHNNATLAVHGINDTGELVLTDDSRLSDARTPLAHTHDAGDINNGILGVARGGTGLGALGAARTILAVNAAGAANAYALLVDANVDPAAALGWTKLSKIGAALSDIPTRPISSTTGTLAVSRGGTGLTTWSAGSMFYATTTDNVNALVKPAAASVLLHNTTVPAWSTVLPLVNGGSAVDNSSQVANRGFFSPVSGANGPMSIRMMVEADVPSLNASKIGSGTLALNRGGTNADGSALAASQAFISPTGGGAAGYRSLVEADIPHVFTGTFQVEDLTITGNFEGMGGLFDGGVVFNDLVDIQGTFGMGGATPRGQAAAITAPTGGAVIDAEARAAVNAILAVLSEASGGFGFTA